ncbi:MAG TPA: hypothetical protein PKD55_26375 [Bellilinea sp.]|nr:hypothetical protein [Bellilinea sp.]
MGMPDAVYQPIVQMLRDGIASTVTSIVKSSDPIINRIHLPVFAAYLATRTQNPREFIPIAHELSLERPFVEARRRLSELEQLVDAGDRRGFIAEVNRLQREIGATAGRLLSKYGVHAPQGIPASAITSVMNIPLRMQYGIGIPSFGARIPLPEALTRRMDQRGLKATFRSIVDDLVSIERLGEIHNVISSAVVRDDGAGYYKVQQEESRYRGRDSSIKKWM